MPKVAVSYIRFSTTRQLEGDSLRRQIEETRSYCQKHGLILDESLSIRDLGKSAFKGVNKKRGALGVFLKLVEEGEIPQVNAIVVEALDRLSRESPRRTVTLVNQLLDLGIEVHLTRAEMVFRPGDGSDGGTREAMDMYFAIGLSIPGHQESWLKSQRLLAVFDQKRKEAMNGKGHVSKSLPWWLEWQKGEIVAVPKRARVVRRIFKMTIKGSSSQTIARTLTEEKVPTWRPSAHEWSDSRVRDLIRADSPLGHLVATRKTREAQRDYRIEDYYPRIVSDAVAAEARAALKANLTGIKTEDSGRPINLLRGLLRHNGEWCRHQSHPNGAIGHDGLKEWHGYYDNHNSNHGEKRAWSISAAQLEEFLIAGLSELTSRDLVPKTTPQVSPSLALRRAITEISTRINNLVTALETGSATVAARLVQLETLRVEMQNQLRRVEVAEGVSCLAINSSDLRNLPKLDLTDPEMRERASVRIRRLVTRIDVAETVDDLPGIQELAGNVESSLAKMSSVFPKDPIPPEKKRRRKLALLVTFRAGGQRLILRTPGLFLISARFEKNTEPSAEEYLAKDAADWEKLSEEEKNEQLALAEANRKRLRESI